MSFLHRHRTICAVLQEIREHAIHRTDARIVTLCDEALTYARSMSEKLTEYKERLRDEIHN
jgi:uncharacterized protein YqgV (UPF0045/DUF77 family)